MNIGLISTTGNRYAWAGSDETWRIFATHALQQGHHLHLLLPEPVAKSPQARALQTLGAKIQIRSELTPLTRRLAVRQLYSRFRSFLAHPHDVLFVSTGGIADCAWMPDLQVDLLKTHIPVVYFNQSNAEGAIAEEPTRESLRQLYGRAAQIIFLSRHNQALMERQLAWKTEKTCQVMNPLRTPMTNPLPWGKDASEMWKFAEVARFEVVDKQQDQLLEALSTPVWKTRNWHLDFFGSGEDERHIQRLIEFFGLTEKVSITGYVADFRDIWRDHHLHVLPSRREGMPLSLIESMACGRPAIVTHAGGSSELIEDGVNGFVCPGMHPQVLRDCLERAWAARESWCAMGQAAARTIQTILLDNWADDLLNIVLKAAHQTR